MFKQLTNQQLQKIEGGMGLQSRSLNTSNILYENKWFHWLFK